MSLDFSTRDEFNRRPVAEKIIQLLTAEINVSPMVIVGVWGSGKSEFTQKLIELFKDKEPDYRPIYLDAFRAEHGNNPILSLLSEVVKSLPEGEQTSAIKKFAPTLKVLGKTLGKAGVSWLLKQDTAEISDDFDEQIQEASDSLIDHTAEKLLKSFVEEEQDLKTLQRALTTITQDKPVVIFIDELDRCRPDYAVAMLESIKHIFDIENLQFVLVTNTQQLKATVNHVYGASLDAQRYLDKFIAFKVTLPTQVKANHELEDNAVMHFKQLVLDSEILNSTILKEINHGHIWTLCYLIQIHQKSLREVETLVRYLEIYQILCDGFKDRTIFGYALFRVIGVYLYTFETDISEQILTRSLDGKYLLSLFGISDIETLVSDGSKDWKWIPDILRMLGREASHNFKQFIIEGDEAMRDFAKTKQSYFSGGYGAPDQISSIVKSSINELRMFTN